MDQASKMLLWPRTIKKPRIKGLQNHRFQVVCISTLSISNTFWLMVLQMCFRRNPILISRYLEMRWQLGVSIPPNSFGYGSIPINTIFWGMNIHLPAILMFTRGTRFWPHCHVISGLYSTVSLGSTLRPLERGSQVPAKPGITESGWCPTVLFAAMCRQAVAPM